VKLPEYPHDGSEPADLRRRRAILRALRWAAIAAALSIGFGVIAAHAQAPRWTNVDWTLTPGR
jgi:hypothetical protein